LPRRWCSGSHSHDDYQPGGQLNLDAGLSWRATPLVNALLQFNAHVRDRTMAPPPSPTTPAIACCR